MAYSGEQEKREKGQVNVPIYACMYARIAQKFVQCRMHGHDCLHP